MGSFPVNYVLWFEPPGNLNILRVSQGHIAKQRLSHLGLMTLLFTAVFSPMCVAKVNGSVREHIVLNVQLSALGSISSHLCKFTLTRHVIVL